MPTNGLMALMTSPAIRQRMGSPTHHTTSTATGATLAAAESGPTMAATNTSTSSTTPTAWPRWRSTGREVEREGGEP